MFVLWKSAQHTFFARWTNFIFLECNKKQEKRPIFKLIRDHHASMIANDDDRMLDIFPNILRNADFKNDTRCFDCKVMDGIPKLFEINLRFGWSLLYDMRNYLRAYAIAARA